MYKKHYVFEKPDDENIKIWRYLDFAKFLDILDTSTLFFAGSDKVSDKFEGSLTQRNVVLQAIDLKQKLKMFEKAGVPKSIINKVTKQNQDFSRLIKQYTLLSCWHMNEYESAAMWKVYLRSDKGVAIQSTFKNLVKSFEDYHENDIFIGKIKYIDYDTASIPRKNAIYPFVYKMKSFEYERELRAVICKWTDVGEPVYDNGIRVPVNLDTLIETIYLSPLKEQWFNNVVKSVLKKYNLKKEIKQSILNRDPLF